MEIYLALLIPAIAIAVRLYFVQTWKAPLILAGLVVGLPFIFQACSVHSQTAANEILGGWVEDATYYERWNEYINRTCTRETGCTTDKDGNRSCQTETYDCSYVENHPEYWELNTTLGSFNTSEENYNRLVQKFKNHNFVEMNRNSYTIDGDAYTTSWNGDSAKFEPYFINHTYENRIQASQSVFNYKDVDTARYKLFPKQKAGNNGYSNSFLIEGGSIATNGNNVLNYYNGIYGKMREMRIIALVFRDKPIEYGIQQESYWKGGNKNEFVLAIGVNSDGKINWVHPFSWTQNKELVFKVRDDIMAMGQFNDVAVANYLGQTVSTKFVRKQFKDFDYIDVKATPGAVMWCWITIALLTLIWVFTAPFIDSTFDEGPVYRKSYRGAFLRY